MSLKQQAAKGSFLLAVGEGVVYGSSFLRNMILARVLTKADFGVAATFSLVVMLLEFSSKLGVVQFVIRDKEGDKPAFIASAHLVLFSVAVLSSIAICAGAAPLSALFGIGEQRWAIVLLALVPLLRGLEHLDIRRFERDLRFSPSVMVEAVPQVLITLAAWPVATWLGDYRAVLVLLLAKGLGSCVGSHLLSESVYRWQIDRVYMLRMLGFGWPLLVNGFLMFGVFQGEQFLVAASYTMADLAPYAAAAALATAPTFIFGRVFNSITLPVLARVQDDPVAFALCYRKALAVIALFSTVCGAGTILGGEALMRLVYGAKYAGAGVLLGWLSASNAFRTLRIAPALAAIAKGDTRNQMISNLWRATALIPATLMAAKGQPLWFIACSGLLGEALACWASFLRLKRRDAVPIAKSLVPAGWILLTVSSAGVLAVVGFHQVPLILGLVLAASGACTVGVTLTMVLPELSSEVSEFGVRWNQEGWRGCLGDLRKTMSSARAPGS